MPTFERADPEKIVVGFIEGAVPHDYHGPLDRRRCVYTCLTYHIKTAAHLNVVGNTLGDWEPVLPMSHTNNTTKTFCTCFFFNIG